MLVLTVKETAPIAYGQMWGQYVRTELMLFFAMFSSGHVKRDLTLTILKIAYDNFFLRYFMYESDWPVRKTVKYFFSEMFWILPVCSFIHCLLTWIGFLYLEAQMPKDCYVNLLNNLKEGMFIYDEESSKINF